MRGRRECRVLAAPMARLQQKKQAAVTTGTPNIPAFPAQWFTAYFVFSPESRAFLPPSPSGSPKDLTPASGCQDHTTSPSACGITRQLMRPRPSRPAPNVRDDREAPLFTGAGRDKNAQLLIFGKRKIWASGAEPP